MAQQQDVSTTPQCPYCLVSTLPSDRDTTEVTEASEEIPGDTTQDDNEDISEDKVILQQTNGDMPEDQATVKHTNGDMTVLCRNDACLSSLMHSWDVETFLEEPDAMICKYYSKEGKCPYQDVGCMFKHDEDGDTSEEVAEEKEENKGEKEDKKEEPIRHSARSRNRRINEERFKRLRDLSISCQ